MKRLLISFALLGSTNLFAAGLVNGTLSPVIGSGGTSSTNIAYATNANYAAQAGHATNADYTAVATNLAYRIRVAGGSGRIPDSFAAGNVTIVSRKAYIADVNMTNAGAIYVNFYSKSETASGGNAIVASSIEYPSNVFHQLTWSGNATTTLTNGTWLATDVTPIFAGGTNYIPKGTMYWVRSFWTNSVGIIYDNFSSPYYDSCDFGANKTNSTMGGNVGTIGVQAAGYEPVAIIAPVSGLTPTVAIIGDSRAAGRGDPNTSGVGGFYGTTNVFLGNNKFIENHYPTANLSISSEDLFNFQTHGLNRLAIATNYADIIDLELGVNAAQTGTPTAISNVAAMFAPKDVWAETISPTTTSSDGWATVGGQTQQAVEQYLLTYNSLLRNHLEGNIAGVIDIEAITATNGLWSEPGFATTDGLHANYFQIIANSIGDFRSGNGTPLFFGGNINGQLLVQGTVTALTGFTGNGSGLTNLYTSNFTITNNVTNAIVVATTYTNANVRSWLVGSAYLASGVSGSANVTCNYTNNGIGYTLPMQIGLGVSMADYIPFCIPLDPLATYRFVATTGTGATAYITNCVPVQSPP